MLFENLLTVYNLQDVAEPGGMPCEKLVKVSRHYFGDRTVGYGRQYAALGVQQQVDRLVRIWFDANITTRQYVIIDKQQYRIDMVQHMTDEDGIKVTDLTLFRLDENFDVEVGA